MDKVNVNHRHAAWDSRVREGPGQQIEDDKVGKRRDERWRPADEGNVKVDGFYAPSRVGG